MDLKVRTHLAGDAKNVTDINRLASPAAQADRRTSFTSPTLHLAALFVWPHCKIRRKRLSRCPLVGRFFRRDRVLRTHARIRGSGRVPRDPCSHTTRVVIHRLFLCRKRRRRRKTVNPSRPTRSTGEEFDAYTVGLAKREVQLSPSRRRREDVVVGARIGLKTVRAVLWHTRWKALSAKINCRTLFEYVTKGLNAGGSATKSFVKNVKYILKF